MNTKLLRELKDLAIRDHYCGDEWYSCPKCITGCDDESQGDECNCGAEEHNKKVNEICSEILKTREIKMKIVEDYDMFVHWRCPYCEKENQDNTEGVYVYEILCCQHCEKECEFPEE